MLAAAGLDFVVAGGFARDTAAGAVPKDADIMVYGEHYWLPHEIFGWADANGLVYRELPSYGEGESDFDQRLQGVAKIGDIDIIFYRDIHHWSQIVGAFDFNVNQFYFPSSVPRYSSAGEHNRGEPELQPYNPSFTRMDVMYAGSAPLDFLRPVRNDFSSDREAYMVEKYVRYLHTGLLEWQRDVLHAKGIVPLNRS